MWVNLRVVDCMYGRLRGWELIERWKGRCEDVRMVERESKSVTCGM
jgi:hypothetical protein